MSNPDIKTQRQSRSAEATSTNAPAMQTPLPRRIVHIVRQFWPSTGGLEDFVDQLVTQQIARGDHVEIITCDEVFADGQKLKAEESHKGCHILRVPYHGSQRYPFAPMVLKHLYGADLVHVHAIDFFFDFLAATRLFHRKPMVATTHGGFFHTQDLAFVKKVWFQTLTRFSVSQFDAVIGCSDNDKRNFKRIGGTNVTSIDNGVNINKFAGAASKKPAKRMISLGRFSKNKRIDHVLDVLQELVKTDPEWGLDIVGAPSDWAENDIRSMIDERNLQAHAALHIKPSNEDICQLMTQCSLFASASEFEGFGLAVVEAMSAGLVPVLHNNPTFVDLANKHIEIGLCDYSDSKNAALEVSRVFANLETGKHDLRAHMIERSEIYSWSSVAKQYDEIYDQVLAKRQ